jgi:phage gpG-like protein
MPLTVEYDDSHAMVRFGSMSARVHASVLKTVESLSLELKALVVAKLSGQVLNVRTGDLRRSITSEVADSSTSVVGKVFSAGDVKYAAIHEFGGVIHHPGGTPYIVTKDMAMGALFVSKATAANFKHPLPVTKPHDIPMPERSFMRSSLKDMRAEIIERLKAAVHEEVVK